MNKGTHKWILSCFHKWESQFHFDCFRRILCNCFMQQGEATWAVWQQLHAIKFEALLRGYTTYMYASPVRSAHLEDDVKVPEECFLQHHDESLDFFAGKRFLLRVFKNENWASLVDNIQLSTKFGQKRDILNRQLNFAKMSHTEQTQMSFWNTRKRNVCFFGVALQLGRWLLVAPCIFRPSQERPAGMMQILLVVVSLWRMHPAKTPCSSNRDTPLVSWLIKQWRDLLSGAWDLYLLCLHLELRLNAQNMLFHGSN